MKPFSTIAKRVLLASSLTLLAACGSNGITDPTAARKSGYLTVSASVMSTTTVSAPVVKPTTTTLTASPGKLPTTTTSSGYNVPAN